MTFDQLGLSSPLLRAVKDCGYRQPTSVQAEVIPAILTGRDLMAAAQTGTGKTAGFVLPVLQILHTASLTSAPHHIRALMLAPTRELAVQIEKSVRQYGVYLPIKSVAVFGGVKIAPQIAALRDGVDIVVATPGRLLDLAQRAALDFSGVEILVLDEADRMLDLGFLRDVRHIFQLLPSQRQNLLFSATLGDDIRTLARGFLHHPLQVSLPRADGTVKRITQWVHPVDKKRKPALLLELLAAKEWQQVLVFCRTKQGANRLATYLGKAGVVACAIHGDKSQRARTKALAQFSKGAVRVLVATDVAARGLHIAQLPRVINFDLPGAPQDYVHRIGRTGRAGHSGQAYSLVSADEIKQLNAIEHFIQRQLNRKYVDGFEPDHELPASAPLRRPRTLQQRHQKKPHTNRRGRRAIVGEKSRQGNRNRPKVRKR